MKTSECGRSGSESKYGQRNRFLLIQLQRACQRALGRAVAKPCSSPSQTGVIESELPYLRRGERDKGRPTRGSGSVRAVSSCIASLCACKTRSCCNQHFSFFFGDVRVERHTRARPHGPFHLRQRSARQHFRQSVDPLGSFPLRNHRHALGRLA
ncbi:hypothetical protein L1887_59697 [Cichorium endivia]|nr:hypothetical protein L1887_59697 [Cichorium endivia]